jgi:regulator of cell morphogenesis and NO signaling|tara:strand:- start:617 stop:1336 length:720 start_codon:yes stop_codon:yes gene_type:complete
MPKLSIESTVAEIVLESPGLSEPLEELGIDYCCEGRKTLGVACAEKGLNPKRIISKLESETGSTESAVDCSAMTLSELVEHIEQVHHPFLRSELPRLEGLVQKVSEVHGESHPQFRELVLVFETLKAELLQHMQKEEQVLFPFVRELDNARTLPSFHCGSVANPIGVMEYEHDNAGRALAHMAELTGNYQPADDLCATHYALMVGLRHFQADLHLHIHKENNILFSKVKELEASLEAEV